MGNGNAEMYNAAGLAHVNSKACDLGLQSSWVIKTMFNFILRFTCRSLGACEIVFILSAIILSFPAFSALALASTYPAVITKITDGDTVWVRMYGSRVKLRLLGIDTPEEYYSKKMLKDVRMCGTSYNRMKQLGLAATRHARTMLHRGENVSIEDIRQRLLRQDVGICDTSWWHQLQ